MPPGRLQLTSLRPPRRTCVSLRPRERPVNSSEEILSSDRRSDDGGSRAGDGDPGHAQDRSELPARFNSWGAARHDRQAGVTFVRATHPAEIAATDSATRRYGSRRREAGYAPTRGPEAMFPIWSPFGHSGCAGRASAWSRKPPPSGERRLLCSVCGSRPDVQSCRHLIEHPIDGCCVAGAGSPRATAAIAAWSSRGASGLGERPDASSRPR